MKVKNIMFSGFAAAILMGTASASAVTFNIASKDYVDNAVNTLSASGGAIANVQNAVNALDEQINGNGTTDGLAGDVADLNEQINGDPNDANDSGLAGDVAALQSALNNKQNESDSNVSGTLPTGTHLTAGHGVAANLKSLDSALVTAEGKVTTLETKVDGDGTSTNPGLISRVTQLESDVSNLPTSSTVSALNTAVNGDPNDANDSGLVGDVAALQQTVGNGTLANGFSVGVDDLTEAVNDLQSTKANAADVYTKTQVDNLMTGKLNVPGDTCSPTIAAGESAWCALVSDGSGNLKWAKITAPFAVE